MGAGHCSGVAVAVGYESAQIGHALWGLHFGFTRIDAARPWSAVLMNTSVAVIIVNYGTADLVIQAVDSVLARAHGGRAVEIHIVDNASPGNDAAVLSQAHAERGWAEKHVTFWPEKENHGFGRGNNVVLHALAKRDDAPEFVFLLNSDAWLENETIDILAKALEADPKACGAGAGILHEDGTPAVAAFRFPTMSSEVARIIGVGFVERMLRRTRVSLPPDHDGAVDWVAGASVMFRFQALKEIGFFDPIYFLYFEEVDMMRRLRKAGRHMLYVTEAKVTHIAGVSTEVKTGHYKEQPRPPYVYASWRYYFSRQHSWGYALLTALLVGIAAVVHRLVATLRQKPAGLPVDFIKDHWRHVILPLFQGAGEKP